MNGMLAGVVGSMAMTPGLVAAEHAGLLGRKMPPRRLTTAILRGVDLAPRT